MPITHMPTDFDPARDHYNPFQKFENMNEDERNQYKLAQNYHKQLFSVKQPFRISVEDIYKIRCWRENYKKATKRNVQNLRHAYFIIFCLASCVF